MRTDRHRDKDPLKSMLGPYLCLPDQDTQAWCERYELSQVKDAQCMDCHSALTISVPFATKKHRGLKAPPCPHCGSLRVPFTYVIPIEEFYL